MVSQSEKDYCRGGGSTCACVIAERKLVILDKVCLYRMILVADHAVAQEVSHWPVTRQAVLRSKDSSCGFCGGQSDAGTDFYLRTLLLQCQYHCHGCVSASQCSLAKHTVPAVMWLHNKAMTQLDELRRSAQTAHTKPTEEKILDMLFAIPACFLFYLFFV